eukprot:UN02787
MKLVPRQQKQKQQHKAKVAKKRVTKTAKRTVTTMPTMATKKAKVVSAEAFTKAFQNKQLKAPLQTALEQHMAATVTQQKRGMLPMVALNEVHMNNTDKIQLVFAKNWLTKRGLFFEDMFEDYDFTRACVQSLPSDVRKDRLRRWMRALDMDLKFKELPDEMQQYDPFVSYGLTDAIEKYQVYLREYQDYV